MELDGPWKWPDKPALATDVQVGLKFQVAVRLPSRCCNRTAPIGVAHTQNISNEAE